MKISVTNEKEPFGLTVEAGTYSPSYETLSGSIVTFSDAWVGSKLDPVKANIVPVQNLNGLSAPYPPGGGGNLLSVASAHSAVVNGATFASDGNGKYTFSGTSSATASVDFDIPSVTLPSTVYVHLLNNATSGNYAFGFMYGNTQHYAAVLNGSTNKIVDASTGLGGKTVNKVRMYINGSQNASITLQPMIMTTNTSSSYIPYSNICPITGYSSVDVSRCGKNLFDKSSYPFAQYMNNASVCWTQPIFIKKGTYTFSCPSGFGRGYINIFSTLADAQANTNRVANPSFANNASRTYTFESDTYVRYQQNDTTGTAEAYATVGDNWQTELGEEPTDYVPYNGITKTISLGTTIYGGILNVDSGVLTVTKAIEDIGNMSWTHRTDVQQGVFASPTITDYLYEEDTEIICSEYNYAGVVNNASSMASKANGTMCVYWHPQLTTHSVYIKNTAYSDATAFKNAMVGQKIVYELATPTTIQLTGEEITALLGENNVWANSGDVEVTYRKGGM